MCVCSVASVVTPWTVTLHAPLSVGFSRKDYWSGLPCPPPGTLPDPGIEPTSLMSPVLAGGFFTPIAIWEAHTTVYMCPNSWKYILKMDEIYCMYSLYICIEKCTFVWEAGGKSTIIPSEEYMPILDFESQHFCGTADFASSYHVSEWNKS